MIRLAVPIVILLLMLLGGGAWLLTGPLKDPQVARKPAAQKERPSTATKSETPDAAKEADSKDTPPASFDVARIDPNGTSVFAGRTEPGARVTVMGDGKALGTARADANGEWSLATEQKLASADPKLELVTKSAAQVQQEQSAQAKVAASSETPGTAAKDASQEPRSAGAVTSHLLKDLEGMVADARTAARENEVTAQAPPALPSSDAAPKSVAAVRSVPQSQPAPNEPAQRKSVPVPITFVFNEATLTDDGRKAAALLLEYLRLRDFARVSLTGHADERGTDELNMNLSRERLETVARFLKDGGFKGELDLTPKGKREPFTGVVRSQYPLEDLYQLDRRVELVITQ